MSAVVYARVPDSLKQTLAADAAARGLSLTQALVELVERGLATVTSETTVTELEARLAAATSELLELRGRLNQAELALQAARERERLTARTYTAVAERARQELVPCPRCRTPVRGCDLFVSGRCPNCDNALTSLLVPTRTAELVLNEYLALLGALGVLVGLALASSNHDAA